eukprot:TRINITY_DN133_c0_g1_i12.p1 TRINITY_DN133_c0_g1~~TRINITY_DN133_c0_g1_i12.p1  ORF type:complete len:108 (+),score=22.21 TRINITY_DN133_c0_g1_i12:232-555(+)
MQTEHSAFVTHTTEPSALRKEIRVAALGAVFDQFDLNHSGFISRPEFWQMCMARRARGDHGEWTREENDNLLKKLDTNGDGAVSREEFFRFFEGKPLHHPDGNVRWL